jgi:monovalent cation:proton antiporter-2 (CPA2) family protein
MHGALWLAFVFLVAAVVFVPVAKRIGLGSVLGYLLAGVVIGRLNLVPEGDEIMHFAEFGVVMMLFLVGLELRPSLLWDLRRPILGLGGLQVLGTTIVFAAAALALGLHWKPALAVGMIVAMSSTAIVLSSLSEKSLLRTPGGQASFSVLLFQDIAVIPILAVFPLLAAKPVTTDGPSRPGWLSALLILCAVALVVGAGRYLVRPAFRWLAETRLREIFTAAALLLVIAITLLMQAVGLSPALGTFLAGVVLAESEYRHELESDIEPFKGLLLGVFFISVGAQIDFEYIGQHPGLVVGLVFASMALKLGVLYGVSRLFGLDRTARWLFAFALAQVGEFAFVLVSFGTQARVFGADIATPLVAVVALTMALTPLAFLMLERQVLPRLTSSEAPEQDTIEYEENPVVIAGYGRFGQIVGRILRSNGIPVTILDLDPEMVDVLRKLGINCYYGDASRPELLHAAGCERARLFILAIDDKDQATQIAETVQKHFPKLKILARARDRMHYFELRRMGIECAFRELFGSSYDMGVDALKRLGFRAHTAHRLAERWRRHEQRELDELEKLWGQGETVYFAAARRMREEAERLLVVDGERLQHATDAGWDNESLRGDVQVAAAQNELERLEEQRSSPTAS